MKAFTPKIFSSIFITATFFLLTEHTFAVAKSWVGSGSGGAGTDFNTGSNWSPAGVPASSDDVTIAMTSTGNCNLSANVTVNNFTFTVANSSTGEFSVGTSVITVNGTTIMNAISYSSPVNYSYLKFNVQSNGAGIVFNGPVSIHTTGSGISYVYAATSNPGSLTFYSDLTIGQYGRTAAAVEPRLVFDATTSQTITVNNIETYFLGENVLFGSANSPTITMAGSPNPSWFGCYDGGVQINNAAIVKAMNCPIDRFTAGGSGTFAMAAGSKLELNYSNNFPTNYPTYSLNATSTVEYLGTGTTQDIGFMPGVDNYGNLIIGGTGSKQQFSVGGINVQTNLTIRSGSTYYAYNENTTVVGNTLISGTYQASNNTQTFRGNFTNDGSFTYVAGASAIANFTGTSAQTISGTTLTTAFYSMTVNNTSTTGVILTTPLAVNSALTLTDGNVYTDATNLLTLNDNATSTAGSSASFVDGPMKKIGDDLFVFPVGDNTIWARIAISDPGTTTTDAFTAQYFDAPYATLTPVTGPNAYVSSIEHWILNRTAGTPSVFVTLYWENGTRTGINTFTSDLHVARWDGSTWQDHGSGTMTGNAALGTIRTSAAVTSFSPFTFASITADQSINPLPMDLLSFGAILNTSQVDIKWETATETNNDFFTIERSKDGLFFEEVLKVNGAGNSITNLQYSDIDPNPYVGISYYRLKQTDFNGRTSYSTIIPIENNTNSEAGISLFPNPSDENNSTFIALNGLTGQEVLVDIKDVTGKELLSKKIIVNSNNEIFTLGKGPIFSKGIYMVSVSSRNKLFTKRLIVK